MEIIRQRLSLFIWILVVALSIYALWGALHRPSPTEEILGSFLEQPDSSRSIANAGPSSLKDIASEACQNFYKAACQKTSEIRDPTGTVRPDVEGERTTLRIYKEIIQNHQDWTMEQIDEELVKRIFTPKNKARIESAFKWVQYDMEQLINRQSDTIFTAKEKRLLTTRLRNTHLEIPPPASIYADEPDLFTKNEAYFERTQTGQMRIRVGGAYVFVAKSWFNLVDTLAHELAHAIDPCEIRVTHLSFPAYDKVIACFLQNGLIEARNNRSECGANDQLSETFADWIAAQIIADALALFSSEFRGYQILNAARNAVRDLCEQEDENMELDLEFHPSPKVRIQKIFGDHPTIRNLLACSPMPSQLNYCTFDAQRTP